MTLKDWIKIRENNYEHRYIDEWEIRVEYRPEISKYIFHYLEPLSSNTILSFWKSKTFPTKKEALTYMRNYMKKN